MADPDYSVIYGLLVKEPYPDMEKKISGELMSVSPSVTMSLSEVEMAASAKLKQSLDQERLKMEQLIRDFVRSENAKYEELCESALKEKTNFLKMVEAINERHQLMDSFDKENSNVETISYSHEKREDFFLSEEASSKLNFYYVYLKTKVFSCSV